MKFLADMGISPKTISFLLSYFLLMSGFPQFYGDILKIDVYRR
jgi:hypothetical protein